MIERIGIDVEKIIDEKIYSGGKGKYMKQIRKNGEVGNIMIKGNNKRIEDMEIEICQDGEKERIKRLNEGFKKEEIEKI